jgi:hypothetical protein
MGMASLYHGITMTVGRQNAAAVVTDSVRLTIKENANSVFKSEAKSAKRSENKAYKAETKISANATTIPALNHKPKRSCVRLGGFNFYIVLAFDSYLILAKRFWDDVVCLEEER